MCPIPSKLVFSQAHIPHIFCSYARDRTRTPAFKVDDLKHKENLQYHMTYLKDVVMDSNVPTRQSLENEPEGEELTPSTTQESIEKFHDLMAQHRNVTLRRPIEDADLSFHLAYNIMLPNWTKICGKGTTNGN